MFFWRNKGATLDHVRELAKLCSQLREDLDDLGAKHERLRGRFYALNGKTTAKVDTDDQTSDSDPNSSQKPARASGAPTKAELLSRYWTPGRPAVHTGR